jgi:hypothetical protein
MRVPFFPVQVEKWTSSHTLVGTEFLAQLLMQFVATKVSTRAQSTLQFKCLTENDSAPSPSPWDNAPAWDDVPDMAWQDLKAGYQLTGHDLIDLEIALGAHAAMVPALARDELIVQVFRGMGPIWRAAVVNNEQSTRMYGGLHWVTVVWRRGQQTRQGRVSVQARVVDSLRRSTYSKQICEDLIQANVDVNKAPILMKWQTDGWRCGYYASFAVWHASHRQAGRPVAQFEAKRMPKMFEELVWIILAARRASPPYELFLTKEQRSHLLDGKSAESIVRTIVNDFRARGIRVPKGIKIR